MKKPETCKFCPDPVYALGLCRACHSWTNYHNNLGHSTRYFLDYTAKHERLLRRASAALGKVKLMRRRA